MSDTWAPIGDVILREVSSGGDHGDGLNDGSLLVDGQSAVVGQGVQYTFHGTLENGEALTVTTTIHNLNNSFVRCQIQLYNLTDDRVMDSETHTISANGGFETVTLSATAGAEDTGDTLALRYIRTDDGNTARDFAIDNAVMNGWFFPRTSSSRRAPDLPKLPADEILQAEINDVIDGWYQRKMPTAPTASELSSAIAAYDALGISHSGSLPTGNVTDWSDVAFLDIFAKELYHNPTNQDIIDRSNLCVQAVGQRYFEGYIPDDFNGYRKKKFFRDAVLLKGALNATSVEYLTYLYDFNFDNFDYFWSPVYPFLGAGLPSPTLNTDMIYNMSDSLMLFCLGFQSSDVEAQRWARGFKRYCERFCTPGPGTSDGIKADGSGFHHWTDYPGYMYAYQTFIDVLSALGTTAVQIDPKPYKNFRNAVVSQFVRSRELVQPISMSGRHPDTRSIRVNQTSLRDLVTVGGGILGNGIADPILAAFYNSIYGVEPAFGVSTTNGLEGSFQLNHANILAQRSDDWTAVMKGFTLYFWGSESYADANRYGRYQSYGTLEVLYKGGLSANGISHAGWDWNHPEGATTIVLPFALLHGERERIDEYQEESFAGSGTLSNKGAELLGEVYGKYGIFGMKFDELVDQGFGDTYGPNTHNDTFQFRKSNFTFGDVIVSLGSGISNNDGSHHTATTLFQKSATSGIEVKTSHGDYTTAGDRILAAGSQRWVLGPLQTGFVVPAGNDLIQLDWGMQSTPPHTLNDPNDTSAYQSGEFAKAYLNHGAAPSNKGYEYAVLPKTTESELVDFSTRMQGVASQKPYRVLVKSEDHHVVCYQDGANPVWGLALFEPSTSLPAETVLLANDRPALVMYEDQAPGRLLLSVTDPDLGLSGARELDPVVPSTVNLDLRGIWELGVENPHVSVTPINEGIDTRLTFSLNEGLPEEVALRKQLDYDTWAQGFFDAAEMADPSTSGKLADPDHDGLANLAEFVLGADPSKNEVGNVLFARSDPDSKGFTFWFDGHTAGVTTTIQTSPDLSSWTDIYRSTGGNSFTPLASEYTIRDGGAPRVISVNLDANPDRIFYRVKIEELP